MRCSALGVRRRSHMPEWFAPILARLDDACSAVDGAPQTLGRKSVRVGASANPLCGNPFTARISPRSDAARQGRLFGDMCSDTTLSRTFSETLTPGAVDRAREAVAEVRSGAWRRTAAIDGDGEVILDVDATPVEIHSESKEGAHCDGGYRFHLLFCLADATGDALAGMLRPGNAAVNTLRIC